MKKLAVLGITGSIGSSVCEIVRAFPQEFSIVLASAHRQAEALGKLGQEFGIKHTVLTGNPAKNSGSKKCGCHALEQFLQEADYDILVNAVAGSPGLQHTITALKRQKDVALANKESLVMAGHIINRLLKNSPARLLPVDSEHSAVQQCLAGHNGGLKRIILTASGGPFLNLPLAEFPQITLAQTLCHPTWSMGRKITVDSATMFNKGLEVIEAHWLFNATYDQIDAVIHPQSIVHSMVEYTDGSIISQMSRPSMKLPILYALMHPERAPQPAVTTELTSLPPLTFLPIEEQRYPLYHLCRKAGEAGGLLPTVVNAANEAAVHLFLEEKIAYSDIYRLVDNCLQREVNVDDPDLDLILQTNSRVYASVYSDTQL